MKLLGLLFGICATGYWGCSSALGEQITKGWIRVHHEVTGNREISWRGLDDAAEWAMRSEESVLAVVCRYLANEQDDISWRQMLPILKVVCNREAERLLLNRVSRLCNATPDMRFERFSADALAIGGALIVLGKHDADGGQALAMQLLVVERQSYEVLEACVDCVALAGDSHAMTVLQSLQVRQSDHAFDMRCKRAERLISGREKNMDDRRDPDERLATISREWSDAVIRGDVQAAEAVMAGRWTEAIKRRMTVEMFLNRENVRQVARDILEIERLNYRVVNDGFEAILVNLRNAVVSFEYGEKGWSVADVKTVVEENDG